MSNSSVSGRIFLNNDPGWYWYRDNGTEWEGWGLFYELFEPTESGFSWVNQGSASTSTTDGGVYLTTPAPGAAGENVRLRVQAYTFVAPTSNFFIFAGFLPLLDSLEKTSAGIIFRENSTGEFIYFSLQYNPSSTVAKSDLVLSVDKYDSPTALNSTYAVASSGALKGSMIWLVMRDDGTDLTWSYTNDNKDLIDVHTVSRTDFLAGGPDEIGYAVNSTNTSADASMTLLSWTKTEIDA